MNRLKRSERIAAMVQMLVDAPSRVFSLNDFADRFGAAKSTVSEDLSLIRHALAEADLGVIRTFPGAAGGVQYIPLHSGGFVRDLAREFCAVLSEPARILPGGFVYMTDLVFSPGWAFRMGEAFAGIFHDRKADVVVTVETKGIPAALMTARALDLPLVILRRNSRVTEGSSVSINYVSGSSHRIQTMSLARRALLPGARVLLIDDFMKGGGTMRGMADLVAEFRAEVVGAGVLVATQLPEQKLLEDCVALVVLELVDEQANSIRVRPAQWLEGQL